MCACSPIVTGSEQVVFGGVREVDRVDVSLVPADHQCLRVLARRLGTVGTLQDGFVKQRDLTS